MWAFVTCGHILNYEIIAIIMVANKVIFLLVQFAVVFSELPQIQKCQLTDVNCIKSSAQPVVKVLAAGIPEVGSEALDPMHVDQINVDLAGLMLVIRDADIKGLRNSVIDKISVDLDKKQMQLAYHVDISLTGKYKTSGKLLILPITGEGETVIELKNCEIVIDILFDIAKDKDGKDIMDLKSYSYSYDVKDSAHFYLGNLFNGNKMLSKTMHTFMNSSWKLLTQEFGTPMFDKPIEKVYNAIKAYLKSQPLENIANV